MNATTASKAKLIFKDALETNDQVVARTVSSFTLGEVYIGFYQGEREVETANGVGTIYSFIDSDDYADDLNKKTDIWKSGGFNFDLIKIRVGQLCRITYEGMKTNAKTSRKFGAFTIQKANHELIKDGYEV